MLDREDVLKILREDDSRAATRAWEALMLARTPEAWSQLLLGKSVPADQLDLDFLQRMKARRAA